MKRERDFARRGMSSVTLPRAELIRKLRGETAHSPFLTQIGWGPAVRGSTFVLNFGLMNPDPWPYDNGRLGICCCWSDAGGVTEPGLTLLRAEPSVGVRQVDIPVLNTAATPYFLSADHLIPAAFRAGPADLNYFVYIPDSFAAGELLTRGSLRIVVS